MQTEGAHQKYGPPLLGRDETISAMAMPCSHRIPLLLISCLTGHCRNLGRPSRQVTVQKQNIERTTDMVIMATQNHPQIAETGPPLL